jgi:hypothetical protein
MLPDGLESFLFAMAAWGIALRDSLRRDWAAKEVSLLVTNSTHDLFGVLSDLFPRAIHEQRVVSWGDDLNDLISAVDSVTILLISLPLEVWVIRIEKVTFFNLHLLHDNLFLTLELK